MIALEEHPVTKPMKAPTVRPMPAYVNFGEIIKTARVRRGWSQTDLANRIGVSQPRVSKIEKGQALPNAVELESLARSLSIAVAKLQKARHDAERQRRVSATPELAELNMRIEELEIRFQEMLNRLEGRRGGGGNAHH